MNIKKLINTLIQSVFIQIHKYKNLVLAYSGGLDSTVLLDLLFSLKNKNIFHNSQFHIKAIHINHNLSKNAKNWEQHCLSECKKRNIKLEIKNIYITNNSKGIEKIMREERYKIIKSSMKKEEVLLTAHHRNDQVETLFLALKRGSGPSGLSAISKNKSNLLSPEHCIVRPLLHFDKTSLEIYAKHFNLNWIEDESNLNVKFDRNFLRIHVLPKLYTKWPFFSNSVSRSAELCSDQELLIDELLKKTIAKLIYLDKSLTISNMKSMSKIKRSAIIRRWLLNFKIDVPSFNQINHLWNDVASSKNDSTGKIKIGDKQICRFKNRLYVLPFQKCELSKNHIYWVKKNIHLKLPGNLGILFRQEIFKKKHNNHSYEDQYILFSKKEKKSLFALETGKKIFNKTTSVRIPTLTETVSIRFTCNSRELLKVLGFDCRKSIRKIWKELEIPYWQRNNTPLLFYDEKLISAIGIFITAEGIPKEKIWKIFWYHNNNIFITC